jgi:hypothetical protein
MKKHGRIRSRSDRHLFISYTSDKYIKGDTYLDHFLHNVSHNDSNMQIEVSNLVNSIPRNNLYVKLIEKTKYHPEFTRLHVENLQMKYNSVIKYPNV